MVWTSANGPKCPTSPEDRGEFMKPRDVRAATIEECAAIAKAMREKHGNPIGDAYSNGVWDQGVRIEQAIRALSLSRPEGK